MIFLTCPYELTGLTCPTCERLREFTKDGSRSLTCPHGSTGPTCPTRDPLRTLVGREGESHSNHPPALSLLLYLLLSPPLSASALPSVSCYCHVTCALGVSQQLVRVKRHMCLESSSLELIYDSKGHLTCYVHRAQTGYYPNDVSKYSIDGAIICSTLNMVGVKIVFPPQSGAVISNGLGTYYTGACG